MKKILSLFFVALFSVSLWGASGEYGNGKVIYLDIANASTDYWKKDQADLSYKIKMYYNNSDDSKEIIGTYCCTRIGSTDIYYTTTDNDYVRWVQALRCAGGCGAQYNYSNRVSCASRSADTENCIYLPSGNATWWDTWVPEWKTYAPPMSTVTLADNETEIVGGAGTELNPYLVPAGETIKVIASGANVSNDADAHINYDFKEGATSKQNSETATYSFAASETLNTTYTINVDGYTKVGETSGEKLAATALYYKTVDPAYVTLAAPKTSGIYIGEAVTITATAHHAADVTYYEFLIDDEQKQCEASASFTYTPTALGEKTIKVIMTYGGGTKEATITLNVQYEKKDIYVKNNCNWPGGVALYLYNNDSDKPAAWPGLQGEGYSVVYAGQWYQVTLDSKYTYVILNNNQASSGIEQSNAVQVSTLAAGSRWYFLYDRDAEGKKFYNLTVSEETPTAIDETIDGKKAVKRIVNGQLVIEREGKMYNALGAEVK